MVAAVARDGPGSAGVLFAEVTPVQPVHYGNVAVTVRIAGAEAATVETVLPIFKAMLCQYYFISGVKKSVQNKQFFLNAITINRERNYCSAACNYALPKASIICLCITYMFDSIIKLPQDISYISAIPLT